MAMVGLSLLGGSLVGIYSLIGIVRVPLFMPVMIIGYMTYVYVAGYDPRISIGTINIFGWDLLFLAALFHIGYRLVIQRQVIEPNARWVILALVLYVAYFEFCEIYNYAFGGPKQFESFIRLSIRVCYPIMALSFYLELARSPSKKFWWFVLVCCGLITLSAIFRVKAGYGFLTSSGTYRYLSNEAMLLLHLPLVFALFAQGIARHWRAALFIIGVTAGILSNARSGFLSVGSIFVVYGVYLMVTQRLGKVIAANAAVFLFTGAAALTYIGVAKSEFIDNFFTRAEATFDAENQTSSDRLNKWRIALETAKENPIGGTKLNLLPDYYGHRVAEAWAGALDTATAHMRLLYLGEAEPWPPHNVFVNLLSRNGVIAFLLFLALIGSSLRYAWRFLSVDNRFFVTAWITANLVLLQFNNQHSPDAAIALFVSLVAFPLTYYRLEAESTPGSSPAVEVLATDVQRPFQTMRTQDRTF